MLTTKQIALRAYWHAVMPVAALESGPQPFRLMGEDIVVFLDASGKPAALRDRCRHRTAKLSQGWCDRGRIVCGYHGWTYAGDGTLTRIPQLAPDASVPKLAVTSYASQSRYGYVWVALDPPRVPLFDIPEDADPAYRRIQQFFVQWQTAPLRFMENSFDNAHFSFVHKGTFGDIKAPKPGRYELEETESGFYAEAATRALNPPQAFPITGCREPTIVRQLRSTWYLPFVRRFDMEFPSGIRHIIFSCAAPMDDDRIQIVQFVYRNDTEADCPAQSIMDWDAAIFAEDKDVLESTDPDVKLDLAQRSEEHMPSDRPSLVMRKRFRAMLEQQGEEEMTGPPPSSRASSDGHG